MPIFDSIKKIIIDNKKKRFLKFIIQICFKSTDYPLKIKTMLYQPMEQLNTHLLPSSLDKEDLDL